MEICPVCNCFSGGNRIATGDFLGHIPGTQIGHVREICSQHKIPFFGPEGEICITAVLIF